MFYSQFILAKKGPLGTIWIAAHLERKLRKNQVADTDIGVSVDSILFPEVPIALRLSSHLLLGVVRIYSRKVNYLFHDCSEALLKIKQAFRSTAVDLPPEESTAPYHSITLPETFDLDDFELPDNAFFQGNFVDHHVSTREQITLQDTMDGMVFSTSQFGLDERFGDGDASQIGLDLDEDLFLNKVPSPGHASVPLDSEEDADPQTAGQPETTFTLMDIDGVETSKDQSEPLSGECRIHVDSNVQDPRGADDSVYVHGDQIQTPDLNEELPYEPIEGQSADPNPMEFPGNVAHVPLSDLAECAQAPSTPGLMEGAILASVQEVPTLSLLRKNSLHDAVEGLTPDMNDNSHLEPMDLDSTEPMHDENFGSPLNELDSHGGDTNRMDFPLNEGTTSDVHPVQDKENESPCDMLQNIPIELPVDGPPPSGAEGQFVQAVHSPTSVSTEPKAISSAPGCSDNLLSTSNEQSLEFVLEAEPLQNDDVCNGPQNIKFVDQSVEPAGAADSCPPNPVDPGENPCAHAHVLQACSSSLNQLHPLPVESGVSVENTLNLSSAEVGLCMSGTQGKEASHTGVSSAEVQGEDKHSGDVTATNIESQQMSGLMLSETDLTKSDMCLDNVTSKDIQLEASKSPRTSEFPEPETLLLAPAGVPELPNDLAIQSAMDKEAAVEGDGTIDRFESLSGRKRHFVESTPVLENNISAKPSGMSRSKRSMDYVPKDDDVLASILVGRRTPGLKMRSTPPPSKRPRMTPRTSKRKVLLDDTMVLHGDVIRQQLTNTEDIRRTRRKAPCTHHEIWMIQKYLLEDEIFMEPLFTGISAELTGLQKKMYHQAETVLALTDANNSPLGVPKELELSKGPELNQETGVAGMGEPTAVMPLKNDGTQEHTEATNQQSELAISSLGYDMPEQALTNIPLPDSSNAQLQEFTAREVDVLERGDTDVANQAVIAGVEMPILAAQQCEDGSNISADSRIEPSSTGKNNEKEAVHENDASCLSPGQKLVTLSVDELVEMNNEKLHLTENIYAGKDAFIVDTTEDAAFITIEVNDGTLNQDEDPSIVPDDSIVEGSKGAISVEAVPPCLPQECQNVVREITNDGMLTPLLDNCSVETGADMLMDSSNLVENSNPSIPDVVVESSEPGDSANVKDGLEGIRSSELENVVEGEPSAEKVSNDDESHSQFVCAEGSQMDSSCSLQISRDLENLPSNGVNLDCQGIIQENVIDAEMPVADAAAGDSGDFDDILDENDTGFLNVDDYDEVDPAEEEDDGMPSAEEDRFIENSGWSSRTRAVARYLHSLFDNEAGRGRKNVAIDNLLVGKTRKEASRMFFETLVLKTKDYIHVEQPNAFNNINILPTVKLMKSEL
ncbi:sister chromatid cohesion 1 protein 4 [Magnolia sinica]|uniref:sister chromatid cohesion 1 protein 4 n=1 Tax=Magnolia sinica TaxID=86752 RepID=UPI0026592DEC|nr:sister chromatid cohesion 1 protein 4 [Magnolia sinica]